MSGPHLLLSLEFPFSTTSTKYTFQIHGGFLVSSLFLTLHSQPGTYKASLWLSSPHPSSLLLSCFHQLKIVHTAELYGNALENIFLNFS